MTATPKTVEDLFLPSDLRALGDENHVVADAIETAESHEEVVGLCNLWLALLMIAEQKDQL
jgi:hypothetical protein